MKVRRDFRRLIARSYPARLLPEDLRGEFDPGGLVTLTVEALQAIEPGDTYIETLWVYEEGRVVQRSEAVLTWQ